MKFVNVGANSWACIGGGDDVLHSYGANQGFVVGENTCLIVDSGFHYRTASRVLARIRKLGSNRLLLLDTHYHSDHVFGNGVFAEKGAAVLANEKCRRRMQRQSPGLLSRYRSRNSPLSRLLQNVRVSLPSITYKDKFSAHLSDSVEAKIVHPEGRAHTDGDSIVYVPEDRVVFSGDVLWVGYHPNLEDADVKGQIRALRTILRWNPRRIVPGHGPVCGLQEVRRFLRYLEEFESNCEKARKESLGIEDALSRVLPSFSKDWKMRGMVEGHIRKIWKKPLKSR
jgi:cyclase